MKVVVVVSVYQCNLSVSSHLISGVLDGERVPLRRDRLDLTGDRDRLELGERFRLFVSGRGRGESAPEELCLRRRSLIGLRDRELESDLRRRRGGVRERDADILSAGELDLTGGEADREVCLGNLLLSWLGDHDLSLRPPDRGGGERRERRGGDLERSIEGDRRGRCRGGVRDRSDEGERRERRGGGDIERSFEGDRRRSREWSRRPPRACPLLLGI